MPPASTRLRLIPIILAQGVGLACGIVSIPLNSHLLPPAVLGVYGLFLTFTPIGMWALYAGLQKFITRCWAASPDRGALMREVLTLWARRLPWLAALAFLAAWVMPVSGPGGRILLGLALFISAASLTITFFVQNALQAERAHWRDCLVSSSGSLTRSFIPPLLYVATGEIAAALWLGFSAHALLVAGLGAWTLRTAWPRSGTTETSVGELTPVYAGPRFVLVAGVGWALSGLNRWLVAGCFGEIEAGYFTLAGGAAAVLTAMLGTVMMQYLQPDFFALGDGPAVRRQELARRVDLSALAYGACALAALVVLHVSFPHLVGPLVNPAYRDALRWIVPSGCFAIATMTALFYHSLLLAGRRETSCAPVDLTTAAVLTVGCVAGALAGREWLARWLTVSPLVPWLVTRSLARHYFFKPAANPTPSPDR